MTTTAKKASKKRTRKKQDLPPLPPSAKVVQIGGEDYVITPLVEYDDWLQDALLAAVAADRIENQGDELIPFEELEARLDTKNKKR